MRPPGRSKAFYATITQLEYIIANNAPVKEAINSHKEDNRRFFLKVVQGLMDKHFVNYVKDFVRFDD